MNYVDYLETVERSRPDATAVRRGEETWTYADLLADTRSGADALAAAGVDAGDAVLVMLPNTYDFVTATLAGLAREAVVVPVNTRFKRREVAHLVDAVEPAATVACPETDPIVASALTTAETDGSDCTRFLAEGVDGASPDAVGDPSDGVGTDSPAAGESLEDPRDWRDAVADGSADYVVPETLGERDAFVLHTSGSTGHPKGVKHTHANMAAISDAAIANYELAAGSTFYAVMPLYHCTGMGTVLGATLKVGGELLLDAEWEPEAALDAIETHDVEVFSGVPTMFKDWLAIAEDRDVETEALHTGIIGGAGVSEDLVRDSEELLDCVVLNGWGMTETFAGGLWEDRRTERRLPSVGQYDGRLFETRVADPETGEFRPRGEPGELLVRGGAMMTGYLEAEARYTDGWFHTGDYARIDEDGFVYLLDRVAYTIITGGENVYPQEVEAVIEELPGVREAAVVARPDDRKGEKPVAFVDAAPDSELTEDAVQEHCLAELAAYKHPREVVFASELPRNAVGKVDRERLEDRL